MKDAAFEEIFQNLKEGKRYAEFLSNVRFPCHYTVLFFDKSKKLFCWRNYGSSANKATKAELRWILKVIFKLSPEEFIKKYDCIVPQSA